MESEAQTRVALNETIMNRPNVEKELEIYISVLKDALEKDKNVQNKKRYESHLAQAIRMLNLLRVEGNLERFEEVLSQEIRSYGWDYIPGEIGDTVESTWKKFRGSVELQG